MRAGGPWRRVRLRRPGLAALATLAVLAACGGGEAAPTDAGRADAALVAADAARADATEADAGPVLDPSLFDCTSLGPDGMHLPERASPVPVACALDPTCRVPQVSAHRGGGGELGALAPEDTLAAYRAGIAVGADFVETDPRPTADGVLVNLHDTTVDRTTDGSGAADHMTLAEIQALHVDAGGLAGDFSCERIPTLVEVLQTCRGRVVVLVDANKTDRVDLLVQAIHDADALDWAIFDTSSLAKIEQALALEPGLRVMNRPGSVDAIGAELDQLAPVLPVIVELDAGTRHAGGLVVHQRGTRVLTDVFAEDLLAIAQGDLSGYAAALDDGVDVLQSDRPDLVIELLRERGER